ncbi:MAG: alpha/beta hydrolase [Xanthomonadales bacterium]|nr:lysophospholipase [Gammaproteobacteria bacterium]MBT8053499.1 lysophospholipase [Gammaproteobacteria bacterium]NND55867.1 alpha/beta hydrolase [Xanthomonadales bacterium]NNK50913.1 alpha/beta hydrolase [Xanthomonadales bacterium]
MTESRAIPGSAAGHHHDRVQTADQLDLVCQSWVCPSPRGVIVIVHGLAEHSGRYHETAEYFCANNWSVFACDLRAHGHSPNPPKAGRVHVRRFTDYFMDVDAVTEWARNRHPELPLFLLGHSMGGLISISHALEKPRGLAGVVISSPALGTHPEFKPPLMLKILVGILSRIAPRVLVDSELDTQAISRDPEVVKAYLDDPLVSQKISVRWYSELLKTMKKVNRNAGTLQVPMLLMQSGSDCLVDPEAPGRWARAAPAEKVELVVWDGLYHEMFNEPEKDLVRRRVLEWLDKRTAPQPATVAGS